MNQDFYYAVVIGYAFFVPHKWTTTKKRQCSHPEHDTSYCSECGMPMWSEEEDYEDVENVVNISAHNEALPKGVVMDVFSTDVSERGVEGSHVAIGVTYGVGTAQVGELQYHGLPVVNKDEILAAVLNVGILTEEQLGEFGIHSAMYIF